MMKPEKHHSSAYDPIGLSGIGFSALLVMLALGVWLIWTQLA
jgi:hypothetical protein